MGGCVVGFEGGGGGPVKFDCLEDAEGFRNRGLSRFSRWTNDAIYHLVTTCVLIGMSSALYAQQEDKSCDQLNHVQSVICSIKKLRQANQILTPKQFANYFGFDDIREAPKCLGQDCREYYLINGRESSFRSGASLVVRPKEPNRADGYYVDINVEIDDNKLCIELSDNDNKKMF